MEIAGSGCLLGGLVGRLWCFLRLLTSDEILLDFRGDGTGIDFVEGGRFAKELGLRSHVGAEVSVSDLGLQMQPAFKLVLVFASLAGRTDIPASWLDSCADTDCRYARNACQLGEVGPSCNGLFGLLENRGRVLYAMLLRKAE